jgi:hypothetical protein
MRIEPAIFGEGAMIEYHTDDIYKLTHGYLVWLSTEADKAVTGYDVWEWIQGLEVLWQRY